MNKSHNVGNVAWLIEWDRAPLWLTTSSIPSWQSWGKDANAACRFDTKAAADAYIAERGLTRCKATQHEWVDP